MLTEYLIRISACSRENREALPQGRLAQVLVQADDFEAFRGFLGPNQGRGELQPVRRSKGVNPEEPFGPVPDDFTRLNL